MSNPQKTAPQEDLTGALNKIIDILLGDRLNGLSATLQQLETTIKKQIEAANVETNRKIQALEKETKSAFDELSNSLSSLQKKSNTDVATINGTIESSISEIRNTLAKADEKNRTSLTQLKNSVEKGLAVQQNQIYSNFAQIEETLKTHSEEILLRAKETRKISGLMSNFAKVLTDTDPDDHGQHIAPTPLPKITTTVPVQSGPKDELPVFEPISQKDDSHHDHHHEESLPTSDDVGQSMDDIFNMEKAK